MTVIVKSMVLRVATKYLTTYLITIMAISIAVNVNERYQTITDYIEYLTVVPANKNVGVGENIKFYSFVVSRRSVNISWLEEVWCADETGKFQETPYRFPSEAEGYFKASRYPLEILEILKKDDNNSDESEEILRNYARSSEMSSWTLDIKKPEPGSTCITRHTIRIKTKYFKMDRETVLMSNPFIYGA